MSGSAAVAAAVFASAAVEATPISLLPSSQTDKEMLIFFPKMHGRAFYIPPGPLPTLFLPYLFALLLAAAATAAPTPTT